MLLFFALYSTVELQYQAPLLVFGYITHQVWIGTAIN